jgi:hypothetical protein
MQTARHWWLVPWLVLESLLPGAALFAGLLWLSRQFMRERFVHVRQYAFTPIAWSATAPARRTWWSCTCIDGACTCIASLKTRLRRCRARLVRLSGSDHVGYVLA